MPIGSVTPAGGEHGRYVHHPALMRRVLNPIVVLLHVDPVLCVDGRRTEKRLAVPMDPPFEWGGRRYLVAPLGDTHWARNLRAAGEGELRIRRRRVRFRAVELHGSEHDEVYSAYASTITCGCRDYLRLLPDPSDHPVFRIEPVDQPTD